MEETRRINTGPDGLGSAGLFLGRQIFQFTTGFLLSTWVTFIDFVVNVLQANIYDQHESSLVKSSAT